ncbi:alpha/beta fold hydrolase [Nocardiopsis ganjiahuensis]|uniref:alpha/beta fold hydrolase n=1 Tax=Nocardiopsis ganjiahuensis TaxID=239984 RepID=UPI00034C4E98|nr:alpha/beta hydrolase [Nocardiopsis ganjiahuensis]
MTTSEEPVLLISGAGLPSWIWDATRKELASSRETAVAARPDGHADSGAGGVGGVSLADHAAAALASAPWDRFAVVAHSAGGVVGAELARLAPERVSALLGVSAVVPGPEGSFVSSMPFPNRLLLSLVMRIAGTRPPESVIRGGLTAGLGEDMTDRVVADFVTEPTALFRGRTGREPIRQRRGYVLTSRDRALAPGLQRRFAANLFSGDQGVTWEETLDTGHLPMLEAPGSLARLVTGFLRSEVTLG